MTLLSVAFFKLGNGTTSFNIVTEILWLFNVFYVTVLTCVSMSIFILTFSHHSLNVMNCINEVF